MWLGSMGVSIIIEKVMKRMEGEKPKETKKEKWEW